MRFEMLDLCSGIGGLTLAGEWAGIDPIAFCEIDPFCQKILSKQWSGVPIYNDIKELDGKYFRGVDVVCAGSPCQDVSVAGKREGLSGERSGLVFEVLRIVAQARPAFVLIENVANLVNMGIDDILLELENIGYASRTFIVQASSVGAVHKRERCFIVARNTQDSGWNDASIKKGCEESKGKAGGSDSNASDAYCSLAQRDERTVRGFEKPAFIDIAAVNTDFVADIQAGPGPVAFGAEWVSREMPGRRFEPIHSGDWREWGVPWSIERPETRLSGVRGVDDGVSAGLDAPKRLKALGNAVVPAQAYPFFLAIYKELCSERC